MKQHIILAYINIITHIYEHTYSIQSLYTFEAFKYFTSHVVLMLSQIKNSCKELSQITYTQQACCTLLHASFTLSQCRPIIKHSSCVITWVKYRACLYHNHSVLKKSI